MVVHDLLCHLINDGTPHKEAPDRTAAAKVFREAMKVCGTGWLTRTVLYLGVRLGEYLPGKNIVETYNPQPGSAGPGACRKVFPTDVRAARERSTA